MKALLVQPPFSQLNAPYPAIHYLSSFLRSLGHEARAVDHSICLYRAVFSREGLEPAFEAARSTLERGKGPSGRELDEASASQIGRYLSYEGAYLEWIDGIVGYLSGGDPGFAYRLSLAASLPLGMRSAAFLEARDGAVDPLEARGLATAILDDLGDLVAFALDPGFGTVRYGERLASSAASFARLREALEGSPILGRAYSALLEEEWRLGRPDLLLITVPFPGCLLGALACARSCRAAFGSAAEGGPTILMGGGYVSTELRGLSDPGIFDFCDYLCFDSGYGALSSVLEVLGGSSRERLYKTMYRGPDGSVVAARLDEGDDALRELEARALAEVSPDYADADFGLYLRIADSENPMHRLWSDSPWLKYCLARGCYWHRCEFCDTELEYVSRYVPARLEGLMAAAGSASGRTGLYGIHFVDEAMPMPALLAFARENRLRSGAGKRPFYFWGNVRFDASWTEDRCAFLAASGLVAVSGGIEIATEAGLEMTDKGFDLAGLVKALVAMKRAGLLVHAYLIYGFPGQGRQDILESAEACRQLFEAGLVDSAFWHRFVLTRHSRMRRERAAGERPWLKVKEKPSSFASNDLGFEGEEAFDEFDGPLAAALEAWMAGDYAARVSFPGRGTKEGRDGARRRPSIDIAALSAMAQAALDEERERSLDGLGLPVSDASFERSPPIEDRRRARWIAGRPLVLPGPGRESRLIWSYRGESMELRCPRASAEEAAVRLSALEAAAGGEPFGSFLRGLAAIPGLDGEAMSLLRSAGLVLT